MISRGPRVNQTSAKSEAKASSPAKPVVATEHKSGAKESVGTKTVAPKYVTPQKAKVEATSKVEKLGAQEISASFK